MINYQKAKISDFLYIAKLDREAWKQNRNPEFIPDGEHVWRVWVEHALVFCAKQNEKIIGGAVAFPCSPSKYFLHKIFVDLKFRKKGIATKLLELILEEIDKIEADCFLTVDPINEHAIKLYEKYGFLDKKFTKGYYRDNEDRYILTRHLNKT
jgi:ribosomal protein S18 acetylase RimI-like enzyme